VLDLLGWVDSLDWLDPLDLLEWLDLRDLVDALPHALDSLDLQYSLGLFDPGIC
jgi:hypothetical protein